MKPPPLPATDPPCSPLPIPVGYAWTWSVAEAEEKEIIAAPPRKIPIGDQAVAIDETHRTIEEQRKGGPGLTSPSNDPSNYLRHFDLCADCSGFERSMPVARIIDHHGKESADVFIYNKTEDGLHRSAGDGCALCAQLVKAPGHAGSGPFWDSFLKVAGERRLIDPDVFEGGLLTMRDANRQEPAGSKHLILHFSTVWEFGYTKNRICPRSYSAKLVPAAEKALGYDSLPPDISTMDAMPLCLNWFQKCVSLHSSCGPETLQPPPPTRLISIGGGGCRLVLKEELSTRVRYATLSHCWGDVEFETLRGCNLEVFRHRIPETALSTTFRHAIQIAKYMGLEYIWIDSLCIVQDDKEDWGRESRKMLGVYGGSFLNLAASSAKDGTEGCFFKRDASWRCQILKHSEHDTTLYECVGGYFPIHSKAIQLKAPLYTRGWVVQERYMAPRTLHFFHDQVFWDCSEKMYCESFPDGDGWEVLRSHTIFGARHPTVLRSQWDHVVEEFGASRLKRNTDRLIAISGLALQAQSHIQDDYVAGLWRRGIEDALYWFSPFDRMEAFLFNNDLSDAPSRTRTLTSGNCTPNESENVEDLRNEASRIAPTWSWASIEGSVTLHTRPSVSAFNHYAAATAAGWGDLCAEVREIDPNVMNNFGDVVRGALRVRCDYLCPGFLRQGRVPYTRYKMVLAHSDIAFDIDAGWGSRRSYREIGDKALQIQKARRAPYPIFLLPLRLGSSGSIGLVLVPCVHGRGRFQRLGSYCSSSFEKEMRKPGVFRQICEVAASAAREQDFVEISLGSMGIPERFVDLV